MYLYFGRGNTPKSLETQTITSEYIFNFIGYFVYTLILLVYIYFWRSAETRFKFTLYIVTEYT